MEQLPAALAGLAAYRQFVLWKAVWNEAAQKFDKFPVDPATGAVRDAHDPSIWVDADIAIQKAAGTELGIAFVFTKNDPFFFVDIDKCLIDGQWSETAIALCTTFAGCAVEVSHSGKGLHIFGSAEHIPHGCKNIKLGLELYTEGRFVALTGTGAVGDANTCPPGAFERTVATYFPPSVVTQDADWTTEPTPEWSGPEDDDALIEKMLASKPSSGAIFGDKATIQQLWEGDEDALGRVWPDEHGARAFDNNYADASLCSHLAFWTRKDCERMDRLFRLSGLNRDKWETREDYRQRTILFATSRCNAVYGSKKREAEQVVHEPVKPQPVNYSMTGPEMRSGFQYLAASQQAELFAGCVYIRDLHRIFTPDGAMLKPEQFKAVYGGYVFALDAMNDKTTKNAYEAFTESQAVRFPKAHFISFRPECGPGVLIEEEGRILVNTYVPIKTERKQGDVTPFLTHLEKTLPNEQDRTILLSYMAACVQHAGVKFQWAPLLQGAEGNGKTLFTRCVAFAIGNRYTHIPPATEIAEKFNAWLFEKLFIGVEDVYVPEHKKEVIEILKPMITNDRLARRGMQQDQIMGDNRANFILNSNHKDAILKTQNDRRFAVFYTNQQSVHDIARDGMDGQYFPNLYKWLRIEGYAIVAQYLQDYAIPEELNPATLCHRAPMTSSTIEVIAMSLGGVEQEIMEAIDEGKPGFAGGWISSMMFDKLLHARRDNKRITPNKRKDLLEGLGYVRHPGLTGGRVNSVVMQEGGKPRLYVKQNHISTNITKPAAILKAYSEAQGYVAGAVGTSDDIISR